MATISAKQFAERTAMTKRNVFMLIKTGRITGATRDDYNRWRIPVRQVRRVLNNPAKRGRPPASS